MHICTYAILCREQFVYNNLLRATRYGSNGQIKQGKLRDEKDLQQCKGEVLTHTKIQKHTG